MGVILSDQQRRVVDGVLGWLRAPGPQWRRLTGPAGTGKTTLARIIADEAASALGKPLRVAFCAFTGRAAGVLRSKGCAGATTVHRLIYVPEEGASVAGKPGATTFRPREHALDDVDLVILDECSMIDARMAQDLLSYGKRVLVLGDPFQLPPVSGAGYFDNGEATWELTEVHRQALDSGILRLATDIREGRGYGDPASYAPDVALTDLEEVAQHDDLLRWLFAKPAAIVVGTHRMRRHFNQQVRANLFGEAAPALPLVGDRLVCLQNDHRRGLLNGGIWTVLKDARALDERGCEVLVRSDDDAATMLAECWRADLESPEDGTIDAMEWRARTRRARFAYGYALTCHKAQGSQFDRMLVLDEGDVFREHADRWRYTAITRAAEQLVVVRR